MALPGRGKRGGARTLVATNKGDRWFFMHGYAKNEKETATLREVTYFRYLASKLLSQSEGALALAVREGELKELLDE